MSTKPLLILACCLSLFSPLSWAESDDDELNLPDATIVNKEWKLVKDDHTHNIRTYYKQEEGKRFRSFRAEAILDASLDVAARNQLDVANIPHWYMNAGETSLLRQVSETEYYYYLRLKTPFGVPERDEILHVTIDPYSKSKGALVIRYQAVPKYLAEKANMVRMPAYEMVTRLTPINENSTMEITEGYVEPGGDAPVWLINFLQRRMPYANVLGKQRSIISYSNTGGSFPFKYKE